MSDSVLYLSNLRSTASPKSYFGENQLSPSSGGISPLPESSPVCERVRFFARFNLLMVGSPGFGSMAATLCLFRLALASASVLNTLTARYYNSPDRSTKYLITL